MTREELIKKRNRYVDKPFYLLRFWLHGKVSEIDAEIEAIDASTYSFVDHVPNPNFTVKDLMKAARELRDSRVVVLSAKDAEVVSEAVSKEPTDKLKADYDKFKHLLK